MRLGLDLTNCRCTNRPTGFNVYDSDTAGEEEVEDDGDNDDSSDKVDR